MANVNTVNNLSGDLTLTGTQNVSVSDDGLQTITFTGPDLSPLATTAELSAVSGTLSSEIDSDVATHAADSSAHHVKYTDAEAVTATESARVAVSGSLQTQIDVLDIERGIIHRDFTTEIVGNTTTRTQFAEYTFPANSLGTGRLMRMSLVGFIQQNTGVADKEFDIELEISDGTTTACQALRNVFPHLGNQDLNIDLVLLAANATDSQKFQMSLHIDAFDLGGRDENFQSAGVLSTFTFDSTKAITFKYFAILSVASTNYDLRKNWIYVELI